ncbi:uncharacterized protein A1O9_00725 [Exophiala aquamarina CBS 119918]|uniref:Major facilitator superfamily (MFS) profile domain-containing protein n=1 Tax=Exophiala aquamarina CBS 119918 TaxID=1182545 RepID=A0A072PSN3_9EURO|nr:uncharacterized protein A1O9_00725 [Exophiala aquamarina CBS 119918]KEF62752.1 hypothetical protein A1O9_00725 [Exophiala aquamarina CBS 119918]
MGERIDPEPSPSHPNSTAKEDVESIASIDEPAPVLTTELDDYPKTNHATLENGTRYEFLTFETPIPLDESRGIPLPNLRQYDSPFGWSAPRKNIVLIISCWCTFTAAYSAGAYSIASEPQRQKWGVSSVAFGVGVTMWALGFACSPMFLAPFSEINGRRPVFIGSAVMFLVGQIGCAATNSFAAMLVFRFIVGAGASTFATMVGGVVSDMYHAEHRNTPMAIYSGSALAGTGFGPLLSGFIVGRASYRWVYYHQIISLGLLFVTVCVFFKETRGSVLLSRKAKAVNEYLEKAEQITQQRDDDDDDGHRNTQSDEKPAPGSTPVPRTRLRYKVAADENRSSLAHMLYLSLTLPFKLLATEPVVFFFSLWASFAWAVLYMTFSVLPLIFRTRHNFTTEQNGAVFAAISIGSILATILSIAQERIAKRHWPKLTESPEGRLYFACLEAALLPIGLFWFGWTTSSSIPWIVPILAIGCAQIGIFVIYLAVFNYLADVYHAYASSALAAQSFMRNLMAAIFPLFTDQMFRNIGYPQASSLLGGISALLTLVPWVLLFNGEKIRARSRIARQIMAQGQGQGG